MELKETVEQGGYEEELSNCTPALAGVAQWIANQPVNQKVAGSIPSQGTCLGCRARSLVGSTQEATTH